MGRIYTATFTEVPVTAQQDLFQIEAITVPFKIHQIELTQTTDVGDAAAEHLSVRIARVTDAVTNDIAEGLIDNGDAAANANLAINETTELVTGLATLWASGWNIALPWVYLPPPEQRITGEVSNTIVVNLNSTPADSITMSGTMVFEEFGS